MKISSRPTRQNSEPDYISSENTSPYRTSPRRPRLDPISEAPNNYDNDAHYSENRRVRCRVHIDKQVKYICLDQYCDFQRLICGDCEATDHFKRHQHRCILMSELIDRADQSLSLTNWPQDTYLKTFQDYLKGQTSKYEDRIREVCNKMIIFMEKKIQEVQEILMHISAKEQGRNQEKNQELISGYLSSCCNFDKLRQLVENIGDQQMVLSEDKWKALQIDKEKTITQQLKEFMNASQEYKQELNQKYGFGYFEDSNSGASNASIIDFGLVQSEFESVKQHLSEAATYISKNAYLPDQQKQFKTNSEESDEEEIVHHPNDEGTATHDEFSHGLTLATADSEKARVVFRPDEKSVFITCNHQQKTPTFFYSNILPQQSIFQLRITGTLQCGVYIGIIDDDQKTAVVSKGDKRTHFIGACLGCPKEILGKCKAQGTGLNFGCGTPRTARKQQDLEIVSVIVEVFINLTKKMITIADLSKDNYIKFNLDDRKFVYNRNLRLFVQSNQSIEIQVLQFNWVK